MITSVEIYNLRGIRTGRLEGFAPLTVLTGPNACGKSTVLDALLIGASPEPADAVGRAVARHPATFGGAPWLFHHEEREARIEFSAHDVATQLEARWERQLELLDHSMDDLKKDLLERKQSSVPPYSMIQLRENEVTADAASTRTAFGGDNQYATKSGGGRGLSAIPFVRLVDPGLPIPLHQTFTAVTRSGRRDAVHDLLADLIPGFERLEIIALGEDQFGLGITLDGLSVPLGLAGDGIQAFVQLALEIAVAPDGLVLVEEPEVYQHPKAIRQSARVLLANVRRGVQVVLTTHSLELIDALLAEAGETLDDLALFNLALVEGELRSGLRRGSEIGFARQELESDLR